MSDQLSSPITLRLPSEVLTDIERVAEACSRTRSWVIVRALRHYLLSDHEGGAILSILAGRAEAAAGGGHDVDDVIAEIEGVIGDMDGIEQLDAGEGIDLDETIAKARAIIVSKRRS